MIKERVSFKNNLGQRIAGRIYRHEEVSEEFIIFCHGLFSTKDGTKIKWLADYLVNAGCTLCTFDFSFVGESEGDITELSVLQEVEDLRSAFRFFAGYGRQSGNRPGAESGIRGFHLVGSSIGGVVSLLYAADSEEAIKSLTLIATPVDLRALFSKMTSIEEIDDLPDNEMTSIVGIPVKNRFIKEIMTIDTKGAVLKIKSPTLVIHGKDDAVVPVSNAEHLNDNLAATKETIIIEDGDHNLTREADLHCIRNNIIDWIKKNS